MFQLTIQSRGGEARSYLLNREHISLGSGPNCDVVISSPFVAPLVARLEWERGRGFRLEAAPGQQSLTVNGHPVLSALLGDGDEFRNGEFVATLHALADGYSGGEAHSARGPGGDPAARVEELEGVVLRQLAELSELRPLRGLFAESQKLQEELNQLRPLRSLVAESQKQQEELNQLRPLRALVEDAKRHLEELNELRPLRSLLDDAQRRFGEVRSDLESVRAESASLREELEAEREKTKGLEEQSAKEREESTREREEAAREREEATRKIEGLQKRVSELERRIRETELGGLSGVERAHETIANLRRVTTQQDGEIKEQRQTILKLQQAKNAAETQLEAIRKTYSRERKQHGRLVDQFRERARRETARADMAMDQLERSRQSAEEHE